MIGRKDEASTVEGCIEEASEELEITSTGPWQWWHEATMHQKVKHDL